MTQTNTYEVAGHRFAITANDHFLGKLTQYVPFLVKEAPNDSLLFTLKVVDEKEFPAIVGMSEEYMQDEDYVKMLIGHWGNQSYFEFWLYGQRMGRMLVTADLREAIVSTSSDDLFAVNNAAMLMFTLTTAQLNTALFHASVVEHEGKAYMFLGKSGTGKSTHAQQWLNYIIGTRRVNDDNPVVRIMDDGTAIVYGSPWSGKTPCYHNVSYPIGGIVRLSQAPENKIRRLNVIESYAAIVPSISGKRWNTAMGDCLHETESALVKAIPIWHLECRPDEEAAKVCQEAIENA